MKVYLGKYPKIYTVNTMLENYFHKKYKEDYWNIDRTDYSKIDRIFVKLAEYWQKVLDLTINKLVREDQRTYIKIDDYDIWNADITLAKIITPLLKKFKENIVSTPYIENDDLPENLHSSDNYNHDGWLYILNEIIWSFEHVQNTEFVLSTLSAEEYTKIMNRRYNGLRLFGKYYTSLWS